MKCKVFGNLTFKKRNKKENRHKNDSKETEDEVTNKMKGNKIETTNKELEEIKKAKIEKVGNFFFSIRKRVIEGKKCPMEVNPETKKLAVPKAEIKLVSLKYCVDTLQNNKSHEDFKLIIDDKKRRVNEFLNLKEGTFVAQEESFDKNDSKIQDVKETSL